MTVTWEESGWEQVAAGVGRCRLPGWDCTAGLVVGAEGEPGRVPLRLKAGYGKAEVEVRGKDGSGHRAYIRCARVGDPTADASMKTDEAGRTTLYLPPGSWLIGLTTSQWDPGTDHRFRSFAERVEIEQGKTVSIALTKPDPVADDR